MRSTHVWNGARQVRCLSGKFLNFIYVFHNPPTSYYISLEQRFTQQFQTSPSSHSSDFTWEVKIAPIPSKRTYSKAEGIGTHYAFGVCSKLGLPSIVVIKVAPRVVIAVGWWRTVLHRERNGQMSKSCSTLLEQGDRGVITTAALPTAPVMVLWWREEKRKSLRYS